MRVTDDEPGESNTQDASDDEHEELLARFQQWDKDIDAKWSEWQTETKDSYEFVAGRQWAKDDMLAMEAAGKVPAVFNRTAPTIDSVAGAEIQGRQRVQYYPREVNDTAVDDILTQGVEYLREQCDAGDEESDAFVDMLICGIGWTETRPDPVYAPPPGVPFTGKIDPNWLETRVPIERVDPMRMYPDPSARKSCFADMRYVRRDQPMSREEFEQEWPDFEPDGDDEGNLKRATIVDPRVRYTNGMGADDADDEVIVKEYQWFDKDPVHIVNLNGAMHQLSPDEFEALQAQHKSVSSVRIYRKRFRRAFVAGDKIMLLEDIDAGDFLYKAMTGKRDRNKGWFYGLVRPMKDPQRFANKFFSQILHIINTNAKGGLMAEEGAFLDQKNAEETWADPAALTLFQNGALSNANGPRVMPKPATPYPQGSDRLMQVSIEGIRDVTGVNQEMLGLADRDQPGVLEYQRKQAAHGILAVFFNSKRRYHKMQGRLMLTMIKLYVPEGTLVRIVGEDGSPEYVPLALKYETSKYDVIVDEAPDGPNQKTMVFQFITQLAPLLANADLGNEVWAELVKYSPLPASVALKIAQALNGKAEAEAQAAPKQQAMQDAAFQADMADKAASANQKNAAAQASLAKVGGDPVDPLEQAAKAAQIELDHARTAEIQAGIVHDLLEPHNQPEPSSNAGPTK